MIFEDFSKEVIHQGRVLNKLIRRYSRQKGKRSLLDCSCGIGTQAIGLAQHAYKVYATDLSPQIVREARKNAKHFGVSLTLGLANFLKLDHQVKSQFDVVIYCENTLPRLLKDRELLLMSFKEPSLTCSG